MTTVTLRQLNRWTLARQMLLERVDLDAVTAIERLAGMQAQYSPSPYIGLWSRLTNFRREELEDAVRTDQAFKATLMRGTLHLISARQFDRYRSAVRWPNHVYSQMAGQLPAHGVDVEAIRAEIFALLAERPLKKPELQQLLRPRLPAHLPDWASWSVVALTGELINLPEDAAFGYFGGGRYRLAPQTVIEADDAYRAVAAAYFAAFGPATRADLAQWSGQPVGAFAEALETLDLVSFKAEDGRALLDLPNAPRPDAAIPAPIRFLPKWDNVLLAYDRRERVLPEPFRKVVIRKNGDVLPTFLIDGVVAGTWDAPLRGRAAMTLTPLAPIAPLDRAFICDEGERLLTWLRPDAAQRTVRWSEESAIAPV